MFVMKVCHKEYCMLCQQLSIASAFGNGTALWELLWVNSAARHNCGQFLREFLRIACRRQWFDAWAENQLIEPVPLIEPTQPLLVTSLDWLLIDLGLYFGEPQWINSVLD